VVTDVPVVVAECELSLRDLAIALQGDARVKSVNRETHEQR